MASIFDTPEVGPVAPPTRETDKVFECISDEMKSLSRKKNLAESTYELAKSKYDQALGNLAEQEGQIKKQELRISQAELAVTFLQTQKKYAMDKTPELAAAYEEAQAEVTLCIEAPDSCTVTGKAIKMQFAEAAMQKMLDNESDVANYQKKIDEEIKVKDDLTAAIKSGLGGLSENVSILQGNVRDIERDYIEKREDIKRLSKDYDEKSYNCKYEAFHDNQVTLENLREDLSRWKIRTHNGNSISPTPGPGPNPPTPVPVDGGYDCRYKQFDLCQGENLQGLSREARQQCRQTISPVCFAKTFETYWILDFFSLFLIPAAALGCIAEDKFAYEFCLNNYAYVEIFKHAYEMGIEY